MKKIAALTILAAGCASVPLGSPARNITLATPEQATRIAANVFERHDFPVRRSNGRLMVTTGPFDARRIWTARELAANVDCKPPKKNVNPDGHVTLQITASARAYHSGGGERGEFRDQTTTRANSVVDIRSSGHRQDGAKCSLSSTFAKTLLEEIVMAGGTPPRTTTGGL